ncbi:MAG: class I SAM-dependent methyltransferase [Methanobacteriota archaeon]
MARKQAKGKEVMSQWDDASEPWADFVRAGKDWTREELNNPAMFRMLGNIKGKKILDLCCGEGYNTRLMAAKGAKVTGVDFSKEMVKLALKEEKAGNQGIDYFVSDAADLRKLHSSSFDIVASFMALMDIEDYRAAIRETARVLKRRGRFVFAICHPCFEARVVRGKKIGGWVYGNHIKQWGSEVERARAEGMKPQYYSIDCYFDESPDTVDWRMARLKRPFKTTSFHRTLTDYANALNDAGLHISRLDEPKPTIKGLRDHSAYFKGNLRIPHSIVIEAIKCRTTK